MSQPLPYRSVGIGNVQPARINGGTNKMMNYCVNCNGKFWSEGEELCSRCRYACNMFPKSSCDEHEAIRERAEIEAEAERAAAIAEWMETE